ncbi:MAG: hypothetical protein Q7S16_02260 [bacterium]|nr:hypothetical protein [bacterium]
MPETTPSDARGMHELTPESVCTDIAELSKKRVITQDQERIGDAALKDKEFALIANRALNQGTDPELLRRTVPESVHAIAEQLGLSDEDANKAIEIAHSRGPGSLAKDSASEWLWLTLARFSTDEAGKAGLPPEKVLAASARKIVAFEQYAGGSPSVEKDARGYRDELLEKTKPVGTAPLGTNVPLYTSDLGFYAAYRTGNSVAAVKDAKGLVFYGTDGSTTLKDAGIVVDKELAPGFGIVFPK